MAPSRDARIISALVLTVVASTTIFLLSARTQTASSRTQVPPQDSTVRFVPANLQDTSWLQARRAAQIKATDGAAVFHDFQFTDRLTESGISFRHRIVDDAG